MEHRWGHRVTTDIHVRLFGSPPSIGRGRLRDVSVSGGFIETQLAPRALSLLRVALPAKSRHAANACMVQAIVIRREPGGVGVEWLEPGDEIIEHLVRTEENRHAVELTPRLLAGAHSPLL